MACVESEQENEALATFLSINNALNSFRCGDSEHGRGMCEKNGPKSGNGKQCWYNSNCQIKVQLKINNGQTLLLQIIKAEQLKITTGNLVSKIRQHGNNYLVFPLTPQIKVVR